MTRVLFHRRTVVLAATLATALVCSLVMATPSGAARVYHGRILRTGTLKICKVAGFGVSVGTSATFAYTTRSGEGSVSVPAGPAPGGYCVVAGNFKAGTYTLREVVPTGDAVAGISVVPSGGAIDARTASIRARLRPAEVTEVTFVDADVPVGRQTGYLEICKHLGATSGTPPSLFAFTVGGQTVEVPPGACSPALEVLAGTERVVESPPPSPYQITACGTLPAGDLVSCDPADESATVTVRAGGVPDETILTVTNSAVVSPQSLWFTNVGHSNSIGEITTAGVVTNFSSPLIDVPNDIALGPDGALWFTNDGSSSIGRITTAGVVTIYTDPTITYPVGITVGPDGALWFTNTTAYGGGSIGRITTAGVVTNYTGPGIDDPSWITVGPDGALWFTNTDNNSIGRITTAGVVTNYTDPSIDYPVEIAAGSDGALWFTNKYNNSIGRITTAGVVTNHTDPSIIGPYAINSGPDGALWFSNVDNNSNGSGSIGRITTAGVVTNYTGPGIAYTEGITTGPDGALWFANTTVTGGGSIGRITTGGSVTNYTMNVLPAPVGITAGP